MATNRLKVGTYTGTGSAQNITGCGFDPVFVMIRCDDASINSAGVISYTQLGSDKSFDIGVSNTPLTNYVTGFITDGFSLGTVDNVNKSGVTYYYMALDGDSSNVWQYTYTGTGVSGKTITGCPFAPVFWIQKRVTGSASLPVYWSYAQDRTGQLVAANPTASIIAQTSDGWTINTTSSTYNTTSDYSGIAFSGLAANFMKFGSFTGNATDNRNITGVGFTPKFAWFKAMSGAQASAWTTSSHSSDNSSISIVSTANAADRVQSLSSDTIQVGANDQVNRNLATIMYWAITDPAQFSPKIMFY